MLTGIARLLASPSRAAGVARAAPIQRDGGYARLRAANWSLRTV